jgi:predicted TIM-barrel fold metal-dependent hydrolase
VPLQNHMKLVSTDDHLVEHPRVWLDRLPAADRDRAPQLVDVAEDAVDVKGKPVRAGTQMWFYEGRAYKEIALNAVAGKPPEQFGMEPMRFDDILPGCYDPVARLGDLDADGIWAQLNFPSFTKPSGTLFLQGDDKDLAARCIRAVNDFVLDEWCATAPERYISLVVLPLWDVGASVAEIERTAAKGAKAIGFPEHPVPLGLPSWYTGHWDPVFAAASDAGLPLCMHFGSSGQVPKASPESPAPVWISLMATNSMTTTTDLLFSPVVHRFPRLRFALSEGGIGWVPWLLERCDIVWERHRHYSDVNQEVPPSELFRRHFYGCFIADDSGLALRHEIGIDNITWECDYPHSDSLWPESRARLAKSLASIPDDEAHRIAELNARRLFNFP